MQKIYAVIGADCSATGHPGACTEPAPGTLQNSDGESPLTIDGVAVADHGDEMFFPSHGHDVDEQGNCIAYQEHSLTPDQESPWTIDGRPLMAKGDSTTDPGSGGTATIDSAGQNAFEVVD